MQTMRLGGAVADELKQFRRRAAGSARGKAMGPWVNSCCSAVVLLNAVDAVVVVVVVVVAMKKSKLGITRPLSVRGHPLIPKLGASVKW